MGNGADSRRPTPPPPSDVCLHHSGIYTRIRDLEGRASAASKERRDILDKVTDIRLNIAKHMGVMGAVLVGVQIALAVLLKVWS